MEYIIVQAGGRGSRLEYLTANKPKALVPVENMPMIFHLFNKFPKKKFIIIADYKKEVMHRYLKAFAKVDYEVIDADGSGTCAGIQQALQIIPDEKAFMLIWSDLILDKDFMLPNDYQDGNEPINEYVGLSQTFTCRWKYEKQKFEEERSEKYGVAGFFLFKNKESLRDVPREGELVRWMHGQNIMFQPWGLAGTREFGLIEEYEKLELDKCRPFNKIEIDGEVLTKTAVDEQGEKLAIRENAWYEKAKELEISILPHIYQTKPLKMEYILGNNIYECDMSIDEKRKLLHTLIFELKKLHNSEATEPDENSIKEAYFSKTMSRLSKIEELVPFAKDETITINGKSCRNVFYHMDEFEKKLDSLLCDRFCFIHGDCTFSNMMVRENCEPVLIDPRGYFGFTELYGDPRYDWAKLYYSLVGNYDQFNLKRFRLDIGANAHEGVNLVIESNNWEQLEDDFFEFTEANKEEIKLLHAVIWLSLTTYAWQDYDSICGAFYNGLWYLEDVL